MKLDSFYQLLFKQLNNLYFLSDEEIDIINSCREEIDNRFLFNCSNLKNKYYSELSNITPYHSCQYTMFLYFVSNTIFKVVKKRMEISDKIYNLLKTVSAADMYYEIELPKIFMFDHPNGSVLGRAKYGNYFSFSQGCTVGNNKGEYPVFGDFVAMMSNSKILGKCNIGNNVIISANTYVKDMDIPSNSLVFPKNNGVFIKSIDNIYAENFFQQIYKR